MVGIIITILISVVISILWANGISKMKEEHPDYKGDDFLQP